MNYLTIDFEEWYNLLDVDFSSYEREKRLKDNTIRILSILEETNSRATFFFLGSGLEDNKSLVRDIASRYEIGIHGYEHILIPQQKQEEFRQDVIKSKKLLEDITGKEVYKYRAPGFCIEEKNTFETLYDCGIKVDSSASAINHQYGHKIIEKDNIQNINLRNGQIKEYPPSVFNIMGFQGFLGGGYFRLLPYNVLKGIMSKREDDNKDTVLYIHPRDLDFEQPRIKNISLQRKFKSYVGLKSTEHKLKQILTDFSFTDF